MSFEFKPVELGPEGKRAKRQETWKHVRRTLIYMLIGAVISLTYTYFNEGSSFSMLNSDQISNSLFIGAFMGFFITNSPCARGKC